MKRKSSYTPDVSDEEKECKDMLPVSENPKMKGVVSIKEISTNTSFDLGEFDQKLSSIHVPKTEETIWEKSSSTLFDPDEKIPDFNFTQPEGVESTKGKSSYTYFGSEEKISDFTLVKPKAEPVEEKSSSTFFGPEGKIPDFTCFEPKAVESMKGQSRSTFLDSGGKILDLNLTLSGPGVDSVKDKSSSSSGGSYDVLLGFANIQDNGKGLNLKKSLDKHLRSFKIDISASDDRDVPEVGVTGKVFIPVFSKGFASKGSCLQNLVSMVDCRRPLEIDYRMSLVSQMVLHKLKLGLMSQGTYSVGMNRYVDSVIDMLHLGVNDVEFLRIYGDKLIKETARAVYDKLSSSFEGCSFLERTSIEDLTYNDITSFQAKLVSDLLRREVEVFHSVDEGKDLIRERFCHMKVLIVLDDIYEHRYVEPLVGRLNCFGRGSRIIFTTAMVRDRDFIDCQYYGCQLPFSLHHDAFPIFNHHAFPKGYPLPIFLKLLEEISEAVNRLSECPIGLEIVGSLLYGKNEAEWESMLQHLRQQDAGFFKDPKGILRMCYDSLTENQEKILLDIACLLDGIDRQIALLLRDDYSLHSQSYHDFEVLIRLALIKIDANDRVRMHHLDRKFSLETMGDPQYYLQYWRTKRPALLLTWGQGFLIEAHQVESLFKWS